MIKRITSQYARSHMYACIEGNSAILFDPCPNIEVADAFDKENIRIEYIFLTHEHYDHISGVEFFRERYDCKVVCSEQCAVRIQEPRSNLSAYFDILVGISGFNELLEDSKEVMPFRCKADVTFKSDTSINWNGHEVKILMTPGHTKAGASYIMDNKLLFSGDVLFADCDTVTKFPTGSKKDFEEITLPKFRKLPGTLEVYPGHYQTFKLGDRVNKK